MKRIAHSLARVVGSPVGRGRGFTLVELLVVAAIIALLLAMVSPTLGPISSTGGVETLCRIRSLDNGAHVYKMSATGNKLFPGQDRFDSFGGTKGTGSAELAKALFTDSNGVFPVGAYAPFQPDMLADCNGVPSAIVDAFSARMPILYYPSRKGTALKDCYKEKHNAAYLSAAVKGTGYRVEDPNATQFAPGFLLISTGKDSMYFTGDDLKNWK